MDFGPWFPDLEANIVIDRLDSESTRKYFADYSDLLKDKEKHTSQCMRRILGLR